MWDGMFTLLSFCLVMGAASFLAGLVPLSFGLSQKHARVLSAVGTGLLIGACLIIIIPEGIETLYSAGEHGEHSKRQEEVNTGSEDSHRDPHAWVGLSLITGFIMMYLIDQIPRHAANSFQKKPMQISLADLSSGPHRVGSSSGAEGSNALTSPLTSPRSSATTVGLVIHAIADGVALAASSFVSQSSAGFIVFLALMIHKAPAAFGLTSVLLKQGFTKRQAKAHLIVFSLAAPVGAIGTWLLINLLAGGKIEGEESTHFATGILLLFSGGTFLYVAVHTMQETDHDEHGDTADSFTNGQTYVGGGTGKPESPSPGMRDTLLSVVGMLLPLLAQIGHAGH